MSFWGFYFNWYQGAVYSNLIASALCSGLVYWRAKVHFRKARKADQELHAEHHRKTRAMVAGLHARIDTLTRPEDPT